MRIPRHLAIIMDGNGRWAEQRHLPRIAGHHRGVEVVQEIVAECRDLEVPYLTLYAFSSENWGRPTDEVNALMGLLGSYLQSELDTMCARDIRFQVIGEIDRLPREVDRILQRTIAQTRHHAGMILTLALSYGSRNELVRAAQSLARQAAEGRLDPDGIDEDLLSRALDTGGMPDPDLLIRTSGEMRISNFLLWQLAYTELYFTETLWPEFSRRKLREAFAEFGRRERRFGLTGAQIKSVAGFPGEDGH